MAAGGATAHISVLVGHQENMRVTKQQGQQVISATITLVYIRPIT